MLSKGQLRLVLFASTIMITVLIISFLQSRINISNIIHYSPPDPKTPSEPKATSELETSSEPKAPPEPKSTPIRKPLPSPRPPIEDNFPLAAYSSLPPIPSWNFPPPSTHPPDTPLFISFTRNWLLLQQTVVSYLTAGWPASQIYVVDNTGTQFSNLHGRLTLQNPFYLDHDRLTSLFNVTVLQTPALLSFAQLQNFYLHTALTRQWPYYFWSHMDVVALPEEDHLDPSTQTYKSLYARILDTLAETLSPPKGATAKWAIRFFAYDRLALYNTAAFTAAGGWDPFISYYLSDCDMHERLFMAGYSAEDAHVGLIYDISSSLPDLLVLYRRQNVSATSSAAAEAHAAEASPRSDSMARGLFWFSKAKALAYTWGALHALADTAYNSLVEQLDDMQRFKNDNEINPTGRNTWHSVQQGGMGEDFHYDPEGFERAIGMSIEHGRAVYREKWGGDGCGLRDRGLGTGDAWRIEG